MTCWRESGETRKVRPPGDDETFGSQPGERLANGRARDTDALGCLYLSQRDARLQLPLDDLRTDLLVDHIAHPHAPIIAEGAHDRIEL